MKERVCVLTGTMTKTALYVFVKDTTIFQSLTNNILPPIRSFSRYTCNIYRRSVVSYNDSHPNWKLKKSLKIIPVYVSKGAE